MATVPYLLERLALSVFKLITVSLSQSIAINIWVAIEASYNTNATIKIKLLFACIYG